MTQTQAITEWQHEARTRARPGVVYDEELDGGQRSTATDELMVAKAMVVFNRLTDLWPGEAEDIHRWFGQQAAHRTDETEGGDEISDLNLVESANLLMRRISKRVRIECVTPATPVLDPEREASANATLQSLAYADRLNEQEQAARQKARDYLRFGR